MPVERQPPTSVPPTIVQAARRVANTERFISRIAAIWPSLVRAAESDRNHGQGSPLPMVRRRVAAAAIGLRKALDWCEGNGQHGVLMAYWHAARGAVLGEKETLEEVVGYDGISDFFGELEENVRRDIEAASRLLTRLESYGAALRAEKAKKGELLFRKALGMHILELCHEIGIAQPALYERGAIVGLMVAIAIECHVAGASDPSACRKILEEAIASRRDWGNN